MNIDRSQVITQVIKDAEKQEPTLGLIAARRYDAEIGGAEFNGIQLNTERDSQGLILGAALEAFMNPDYHVYWKTPAGFISLDASTVLLVAKTIRAHVQACFDREAALIAAVESGTYTDAMLNEGWPS